MSYQEKRRASLKKAGLCVQCAEPRGESARLCDECLKKERSYRRKVSGYNRWKPGTRGQPPLGAKATKSQVQKWLRSRTPKYVREYLKENGVI